MSFFPQSQAALAVSANTYTTIREIGGTIQIQFHESPTTGNSTAHQVEITAQKTEQKRFEHK